MQPVDDVRAISRIAYGFIASQALFAALELDVFGHLQGGAKSLDTVAAACGVARITVFNGFAGERFVARWRPDGAGFSRVLFVSAKLMEEVWGAVESAIL